MPFYGQYDNMMHHSFPYRTGQGNAGANNASLPLPISMGYNPTLVLPSSLSAGQSFHPLHNKPPSNQQQQQSGFYPAQHQQALLVQRTSSQYEPSIGTSQNSLHQTNQATTTWSGVPKSTVIVSKSSNSQSSNPSNGAGSFSTGSISNGTPIRPPSRETIPTSTSSLSQTQCFAGVMNIKSGTLCGTLAPVTLNDLTRPSRVKAITATIPVATDMDLISNNAMPMPSPNTNNSNSSTSRHSSTPSTPSTPVLPVCQPILNDPPGLMPPPESPKFVLAPTPAQLGRAPFQRRQSSTIHPASPSGSSSQHSDEEDEPFHSPENGSAATDDMDCSNQAATYVPSSSPTVGTATVSGQFTAPTTAPSTPSVPPSPNQNGIQLQIKRNLAKRNKEDGMDK